MLEMADHDLGWRQVLFRQCELVSVGKTFQPDLDLVVWLLLGHCKARTVLCVDLGCAWQCKLNLRQVSFQAVLVEHESLF